MTLNVRWNGGIEVEAEDTTIVFDPTSYNPECDYALITHAHSDHSRGLSLPFSERYCTEETVEIATIYRRVKDGWHQIRYGDRFQVEDFEVKVHNAGHILGSVIYEVISDEGNFVYTGDLNTVETLTMEAAEAKPCDILAIDATFGSPSFIFPSREDLSVEIAKWSIETLRKNRIPTFQTDSVGNAQEITAILNEMTNIPIVTHPRISAVNGTYRSRGYSLNYIDACSEDAAELISECACALILPKRAKVPKEVKVDLAFASGWAMYLKNRRKPIPLSDHADFINLLKFIGESNPKVVLTFHGGKRNSVLASYVRRKLGIEAKPISEREVTLLKTFEKKDSRSVSCEREVLRTVKMRGFIYRLEWIQKILRVKGYSDEEVRVALRNLVKKGFLRFHSREGEFEVK